MSNNKKIDETADQLTNDWDNIKTKAYQTTEAIGKATTHAKDRAKEMFDDSWQDLRDRTDHVQGDVEKYVRQNPLKSLGIAALAGVLLSQLLRK